MPNDTARTRPARVRACAWCAQEFEAKSRSKFCGSACRRAALRKHKQELRARRIAELDPVHKICSRCGTTRLRSEFRKDAKRLDGLFPWCIHCWREYNGSEALRHSTQTKAEYDAARRKKLRLQLSEAELYAQHREAHLLRTYNMTLSDYDEMLAAQGGRCAICGLNPIEVGVSQAGKVAKALSVDHDHSCCPGSRSCGKCVRALLCTRCNAGLGSFRDDPTLLRRATEYLTENAKTPTQG